MTKSICIDFDGPINPYTGWKGRGVFEAPKVEMIESLKKLRENGWRIIVHTCRSETSQIMEYMENWGIPYDFINYNPDNTKMELSSKPIADVYLDDRAITFDGSWDGLVERIEQFKPHYQKMREK